VAWILIIEESFSVARKPVKQNAKTKGQKKAKRQTKKHQAKHQALRFKVLLGPLARLWVRVPPRIRVPGMSHDVETNHLAVFGVVLVMALGGGYLGAQALFGPQTPEPVAEQRPIIQQSLDNIDVILPEYGARAYEERVVDHTYEPPVVQAPKASQVPPAQVASLTSPTQPVGKQPLWMQNAIAFTPSPGKPMIAIVIDDMGVDLKRSRRMWEDVPAPLTLSFMTYADNLPQQTKAAHKKGHELMLHMSMEPSNPMIDAGPNVLMTAMKDDELAKLTQWGLGRFEGYVGMNNHMGSRFTEDSRAMQVVLEQVKQRGVFFLDSRTSPKSVAGKVARTIGMPALDRNVFLDNDNDVNAVLKQLGEVERMARKHGVSIAIGHPREATIKVLKTWIPEAIDRGLAIVPISTLMKLNLARKTN